MLASFLTHAWQFFLFPQGSPWYTGAIWGNVVALIPCGILGVIWAKTKYWPLNLIHTKLDHVIKHHRHNLIIMEEVHHKLHTGEDHPRVKERREAGLHPTPKHFGLKE